MNKVVPELNYSDNTLSYPSKLYVDVMPINNQSSFNLQNSAVVGPISFILNNRAMNLARSSIEYNLEIPFAGTFVNYVQANMGAQISRIVCTTLNSNAVLFDSSNIDKFSSAVGPAVITDDVLHNSYSSLYSNSTTAIPAMGNTGATGANAYQPCSVYSKSNSIANFDGLGITYNGAYESRRLLFQSSNPSLNTAGTDRLPVKMKLADLCPMSIFALDKDLYFNENVQIDLYFNSLNAFCWTGTSLTDPTAGAVAISSTVPLSGLKMKVCAEQDATIIESLQSRVLTEGMKINFFYPYSFQTFISSSTTHSAVINLSRAYGKKLIGMFTCPYNTTSTLFRAQDHSLNTLVSTNTSAQFQSFMDNIPIRCNTPQDLIKGDAYLLAKDELKHSLIKSAQNFNIDTVFIDNFCNSSLSQIDMTDELGFPLDANHQWSFQVSLGSTAVAVNYYIFIVAQKTLLISKDGCQVV